MQIVTASLPCMAIADSARGQRNARGSTIASS